MVGELASNEAYIDTRLDDSNVIEGTKRIEQSMRSMGQTVEQTAGSMQKSLENVFTGKIPTDQYLSLQRELDILDSKFNNLVDKEERFVATGGNINSTTFKGYEYDIEQTASRISEINAQMEQMRQSGTAYASPYESIDKIIARISEDEARANEQMQQFGSNAEQASKSVEKIGANLQSIANENANYQKAFEVFQQQNPVASKPLTEKERKAQALKELAEDATVANQKVADLSTELNNLKEYLADLKKAGLGFGFQEFDETTTRIRDIQSELREYQNTLENPSSSNIFASALDRLGDSFIRVGKAIPNAALNAFKKGLQGFGWLIQKTLIAPLQLSVMAMKQLAKHSKKTTGLLNGGFSKGLKTILKYSLGIRSLYVLFNKFRRAIIDGFKSLAQFNDGINPVNTSLSNLKSALTQLKNSFATAFAPVLTAIEPALTRLINLISQAVTWIGMLLSLLGGKGTFIKAKKVTEDYAESLNKTGGSAKKAHKQLLSIYDDLIVLNKEEDNGGGISPNDMFEEVPIDEDALKAFEKLKDMWKKADFSDLGRNIGEALKKALDNIDWNEIKESAKKLGKSLATLINGFIEVDGLGYSIGKSIAEALNTAFEFANSFLKKLHWGSLGYFIADTLNGFFENIDWKLIRRTLVNGFRGLAIAINSFTTFFHWDNISDTISNGLNIIAETVHAFFTTVEWGDLGYNLGNQLMESIRKTNWRDVGQAIGDVFNASLDFLKEFLLTLDVEDAVNALWEAINGFLDTFDGKELGEVIGLIFDRAYNFVIDFIKNGDWNKVGQEIMDVIKGFFDTVSEDDFESVAGIVIGALAASLSLKAAGFGLKYLAVKTMAKSIVSGIGTSVAAEAGKTGIFSGAVNAIKGGFSTAFSSVGGLKNLLTLDVTALASEGGWVAAGTTIATGVIAGVAAAIGGWHFGQFLYEKISGETIDMPWEEQFDEIFKSFSDGSWKDAIKLWGDDIYMAFVTLGERQEEFVNNFIDNMKKVDGSTQNTIKSSDVVKDAFSGVNKTMLEMCDSVGIVTENSKEISDTLVTESSKASSAYEQSAKSIKTNTNELHNTLKNTATEVDSLGNETILSLQDKTNTWDIEFEEVKDNTIDSMDTMGNTVVTNLDSDTQQMSDDFKDFKKNANESTQSIADTTKNNMKNTGDSVKSVKGDLEESKGWFKSFCDGVKGFFEGLWNGISGIIESIKNGIRNISGGGSTGALGTGTGFSFGRSMPLMAMANAPIPALATGTVIPRQSSEFIAKLGDNNRETEVVSPLSTIRKALAEELASQGFGGNLQINLTVDLDGDIVYNKIIELDRQTYNRTGASAFGY